MSPEAQRIAIAEACPDLFLVRKSPFPGPPSIAIYRKGRPLFEPAEQCNVLTDLNAMHEVEMTRVDLEDGTFIFVFRTHLHKILGHDGSLAIHATAAQRAEAFLRTIGKWTED